jgi:type II secretory pathway component GspD/PulD (secretin)
MNLYDVTVKQAIYSVAQAAGYWVEIRNGDYIILGRETSLDYPGTNTVVETLKVQYSDPKQVADILAKYVSRYGKITPLIGRRLVVVEDLPGFIERIKGLLAQVDVAPRQIMIEAKILEINLTESENFGIDWKKIWSSNNYPGSVGTSGLASGTATAPTPGLFFSLLGDKLTAYLSALATNGRIRTLSTPKLLAMENQEAKTVIGDSTGYVVTTTINLVTTQTVQFLESGVILRVTPSIDQQGRILLSVHPEVSSASLSAAGVPSKKSTEVTTEMVCEDGQSIFIGGLIKNQSSRERSGVPVLGRLPLVGGLFANSAESTSFTETVVIITPYIVSEPKDADRFSQEKVRQAERASGLILEHQLSLERRVPTLPPEGPHPEDDPNR